MNRLIVTAVALIMALGLTSCGSKDDVSVADSKKEVAAVTDNVEENGTADNNDVEEDNIEEQNTIIGIWHNVSSIKIGDERYRGSDDPNMITCEFSENQTIVFKSQYDTHTFLFTRNEFSNWVSGSWVLLSTDEGVSEYALYCDGDQFGTAFFDSSDDGGLIIKLDRKDSELHFDSQSCKYVED